MTHVKGHTVKNTKKVLLATLAAGSMLALAACSGGGGGDSGEGGGDGGLIGVAMPTKSSERWIQDGDAVKEQLEEQGFTVDLQYAEDDIPTQVSQIENMITKGAEALIIASIDGTTLSQVLQDAADADIPVIAYDRLIRDSENVDYYASFDNYIVGVQQATSLLNGLGLTDLEGDARRGRSRRSVQHRAVRRFARRQQRHVLLERRDRHAPAAHR